MDEINETPVKRGRGRPRLSAEEKAHRAELRAKGELPMQSPNLLLKVDPGDNARYLAHAMAIRNMPPIDHRDPRQVEDRIDWYFQHCINSDMKPTVMGFCNSIGVSRQTLNQWKHGAVRAGTHQEIILNAYALLEEMWENYMQNGKINPMAGVFLGVNNFGYRDVKQVNVAPTAQDQIETIDVATIEAKYAELPEGE